MSPSPTLQEWGFGRVFFTGPCLPKITHLFIGKVVAQSYVHIGVILGDGWPGTPLSREWGGTPPFEVQD